MYVKDMSIYGITSYRKIGKKIYMGHPHEWEQRLTNLNQHHNQPSFDYKKYSKVHKNHIILNISHCKPDL